MLGTLARLHVLNGRLDEAKELIETAQSLKPALPHWHSRGDRLQLLAEIAVQQGAPARFCRNQARLWAKTFALTWN